MLKQPPEQSEAEVKLIELLRNSKNREQQAVATFMDTRLEWYVFQALKAASADGFDAAEVMSAYIAFEGGNIFALTKMQKDPELRVILTLLAAVELQAVAKKLLDGLKK